MVTLTMKPHLRSTMASLLPRFLHIPTPPPLLSFQHHDLSSPPLSPLCGCLGAEKHASRLSFRLEFSRTGAHALLSPHQTLAWYWVTTLGMKRGVMF